MFFKFVSEAGRNERRLKKYRELASRVEEQSLNCNSPEAIRQRIKAFRQTRRHHAKPERYLADRLPLLLALCGAMSYEILGQAPYPTQFMAAGALLDGNVAEMGTGEGKTLAAALAASIRVLDGEKVHIVTANSYLALRDATFLAPYYQALGITVGVIDNANDESRARAYRADIIYGTASEFAFDYLRDNMVMRAEQRLQQGHHTVIVDEADSVLLDNARTPFVLSVPVNPDQKLYAAAHEAMAEIDVTYEADGEGDIVVDEEGMRITITDQGAASLEQIMGVENLYAAHHADILHRVEQAAKANFLYARDVHYLVGERIILVDPATGRPTPERVLSDGLHQALEIKEFDRVLTMESEPVFSISFQNYFRLYRHLAGMTGTARSEADEFRGVYGLEVVTIPPQRPCCRLDHPDLVFASEEQKILAVVEDIATQHAKLRPVLVGTRTVADSERLSARLSGRGVPHQVLNAANHEREAEIIAAAGQMGMVTVATNMAGRGVDILLGDQQTRDNVLSLGGLYVIGFERHESRRLDDQLRGRCGRQGDPGESRFYLSLDDDLPRVFGGDYMSLFLDMIRKDKGEGRPLDHPLLTRAIRSAQRKMEIRNWNIRKQLLETDSILDSQRKIIYSLRNEIIDGEAPLEIVGRMVQQIAEEVAGSHIPLGVPAEQWVWDEIEEGLKELCGVGSLPPQASIPAKCSREAFAVLLKCHLMGNLTDFVAAQDQSVIYQAIKEIMLIELARGWRNQLHDLERLKKGLWMRAYTARNLQLDTKIEAYHMFVGTLDAVRNETLKRILPPAFAG